MNARARRILFISHAYAAPINRQKLAALARRPGLEVSLLLPRLWRERDGRVYTAEAGEEEGVRIIPGEVVFPGRVTGHFYRSGLLRALREVRPDIIHLEEEPWAFAAAQVLAASAIVSPRPALVLFSFENIDLALPWYRKWIERKSLAAAAAIIAGGESSRARLLGRGADPARMSVLPQFGLDIKAFRPPAGGETGETGETGGEFTVGFIGRLVRQKGIDILIRALADLGGGWRAIIIGEGPERAALESLARSSGAGERIEFAGWVDHFEVPKMIRRMHALVLPSRSTSTSTEQFGHVLIEAMSSGAIPVGSDSGEIPGVIGSEGFVFPEGDAGALAGILRKLQGDPGLRRRLAEAGRARAVREYGWEAFAGRTEAIYDRVLAPGAAAPGSKDSGGGE